MERVKEKSEKNEEKVPSINTGLIEWEGNGRNTSCRRKVFKKVFLSCLIRQISNKNSFSWLFCAPVFLLFSFSSWFRFGSQFAFTLLHKDFHVTKWRREERERERKGKERKGKES